MNPQISIIVPVYNVEKYLRVCVDSLLNQRLDRFEIILVDDGSTDSSGVICDEYAERDKRVEVIHKRNGGLSSARNEALDVAKGDFIGFVDSDDYIMENMYKLLIKRMEEDECDISVCNMLMQKSSGDVPYHKNAKDEQFSRESTMTELIANRILTFSVCNKLFKKSIFNGLRFKEGIILEDMDIIYKLFHRARKVSYLSAPLYYYRYNESSILRKPFTLKRIDEFYIRKEMYDFYQQHYPETADLVYFRLCVAGSKLYNLVKIGFKEKSSEYLFLIEQEKSKLARLLWRKDVHPKEKLQVMALMISPKNYHYFMNL